MGSLTRNNYKKRWLNIDKAATLSVIIWTRTVKEAWKENKERKKRKNKLLKRDISGHRANRKIRIADFTRWQWNFANAVYVSFMSCINRYFSFTCLLVEIVNKTKKLKSLITELMIKDTSF